jgi:hypothetical protein
MRARTAQVRFAACAFVASVAVACFAGTDSYEPGIVPISTSITSENKVKQFYGWGFILDVPGQDGQAGKRLLVTNAHLIGNSVRVAGEKISTENRLIDPDKDIALLEIPSTVGTPLAKYDTKSKAMVVAPGILLTWTGYDTPNLCGWELTGACVHQDRAVQVAEPDSDIPLDKAPRSLPNSKKLENENNYDQQSPFILQPEHAPHITESMETEDHQTNLTDNLPMNCGIASCHPGFLRSLRKVAFGGLYTSPTQFKQGMSGLPVLQRVLTPSGMQYRVRGMIESILLPFKQSYVSSDQAIDQLVDDYARGKRGSTTKATWKARQALLYLDYGNGTQDIDPELRPSGGVEPSGGERTPGGGERTPGGGDSPKAEDHAPKDYLDRSDMLMNADRILQTQKSLRAGIRYSGKSTLGFLIGSAAVSGDRLSLALVRSLPKESIKPLNEGIPLSKLFQMRFGTTATDFTVHARDKSITYHNGTLHLHLVIYGSVLDFDLDRNGALVGSSDKKYEPYIKVKGQDGSEFFVDVSGLFFISLYDVLGDEQKSSQKAIQKINEAYAQGPRIQVAWLNCSQATPYAGCVKYVGRNDYLPPAGQDERFEINFHPFVDGKSEVIVNTGCQEQSQPIAPRGFVEGVRAITSQTH